ncbi:redoxin family protein [Tundrisphaera lichenicola]|uniref:redoxin family protein n=1 Tax=Tundrisphaera lichenicola TaxID=2029860 RepID=UPI003EBF0C10
MRAFRTTWAVACFLAVAPAIALAAPPTVAQLMAFKPSQKGVEYDVPSDPAAIAACKVEPVANGKGASIGWALRDGQGKLLCRFVDSNGSGRMNQWSYYQDGFEIYREIDVNNDQSLDEVHWMNSAGTRVAKLSGGKIVSWTRISAEEASKVLVQSLISGDSELLETVMASPAELEALGIPKGEIDQVAEAEKQRVAMVKTLRSGLVGWDANTRWQQFQGALPHLIAADAGLKDDLILYENALIFVGSSNNNAAKGLQAAFLQSTEMVKIGETWKFVDLPRVIDPNKNVPIAAVEGGIRSWVFREAGNFSGGGENPAVAEAMQALAAYDKDNKGLLDDGSAKNVARFHVGRVPLLNKVVKAAESANEPKVELDHQKLIVDSLAAAYTTGSYPDGAKVLEGLAAKGGKAGTYAAFKQIEADFALQNADQGLNLAVQEAWLEKLKGFVEKYPQCDEAPQALLFLASTNELNGREADAKKYYTPLAADYAETEWGKKAAGALKRLDSVGKPIVLKGTDLQGQSVDAGQYKGKTLLVVFWATWANLAKRDLPDLAKLQAKYKAKGFEVIGVNLDNDKAELDAFLQASPHPWPELFEPGGLESRLATEFGIISLPTMLLVDPDGKVTHRNLRTSSDLEIVLDKALDGKVALGDRK